MQIVIKAWINILCIESFVNFVCFKCTGVVFGSVLLMFLWLVGHMWSSHSGRIRISTMKAPFSFASLSLSAPLPPTPTPVCSCSRFQPSVFPALPLYWKKECHKHARLGQHWFYNRFMTSFAFLSLSLYHSLSLPLSLHLYLSPTLRSLFLFTAHCSLHRPQSQGPLLPGLPICLSLPHSPFFSLSMSSVSLSGTLSLSCHVCGMERAGYHFFNYI